MNCGSGRGRRGSYLLQTRRGRVQVHRVFSTHKWWHSYLAGLYSTQYACLCALERERGQTGRDGEVEKGERGKRKVNMGVERENEATEG